VKSARCHGTGLAQIDLHVQFDDSVLFDICFADKSLLFPRGGGPAAMLGACCPSTSLLLLTKSSQMLPRATHPFTGSAADHPWDQIPALPVLGQTFTARSPLFLDTFYLWGTEWDKIKLFQAIP